MTRKEAIETIRMAIAQVEWEYPMDYAAAFDLAIEALNQPELVQCKDCKYWTDERILNFNKCRRWINVGVKNFATIGDWFCADGAHKEVSE